MSLSIYTKELIVWANNPMFHFESNQYITTTVISPINIEKCFTELTSLFNILPVSPVPLKTDPGINYTKRDHFDELQIHYHREKSFNKECCYIATLSLSKMSTVIGRFLVTCP